MRNRGVLILAVLLGSIAAPSQSGEKDGKLTPAEAKKLKSPVAYTKKSINKGREIYARTCFTCHGPDGKAQVDVIADATDLTSPKLYKSGISEGEIYRSIRDGAGANLVMPPFKDQLKDEETWHLVNYIRSLWPEDKRPELQPEDSTSGKKQ